MEANLQKKSEYFTFPLLKYKRVQISKSLHGNESVIRVLALQQVQQVADADDMRRADVPTGGLRRLIDQEQRVGQVADVDNVPQFVPHSVRASCIGAQRERKMLGLKGGHAKM
jgi:hypothetical protein